MRCWKRFLKRWEPLNTYKPWPRIEAAWNKTPEPCAGRHVALARTSSNKVFCY
jgi:hypothetical protein